MQRVYFDPVDEMADGMGWNAATADTIDGIAARFPTRQQATAFADYLGEPYTIEEPTR